MIEITSRDNPRLKHCRNIRDGRETDFVFIEGLRLAREAMRSPVEIAVAVFAKGFEHSGEFSEVPESIVVPDRIFDSLADTKSSQGIVLIAKRPNTSKGHFTDRFSGNTAVFLNRINNPSNLGAILRTCEAAGTTDVVISSNSADVFSPKGLRASMAAALRLNIWANAEFDDAVSWSRSVGLVRTATDVSAKLSYRDVDWEKARLIVFGSEAHGLEPAELAAMDELIVIPMENDVESLNLAVSAGIILFEKTRSGS